MYHTQSNYDCPICGLHEKEIQFYGFSCCNHPICGVCAIKLQKFSKDDGNEYDYSKCVICKQDISKIILSSHIAFYEDYNEQHLIYDDVSLKYNILFESLKEKDFFHKTITISCRQCSEISGVTMEQLIEHLRSVHKKRYCELCLSFNKCLQYEMEEFNNNDYHQHNYKKHPKCRFCDIRFYDDSHLIKHVKDEHFVCDICHRNEGCVAYNTQGELLKHYLKDHFVCEICRSSNTINVFESEYNLKTHKVSVHAHSLVGEGLVNVNYGDRNTGRYGSRRKPRDAGEDFFEESLSTTHESHQELPTMDCEQDFPRLGAEAANQQLGMPSLNPDDNDARTAFISAGAKPAMSSNQNLETKKFSPISNNFAISVKKFAGIGGGQLNTEDFPVLSPQTAPVKSGVPVTRPVNHNKHKMPAAVAALEGNDDFPALPTGSNSSKANGRGVAPSWNIVKSLPGQPIRHPAPLPVSRQATVNREECNDAPVVTVAKEPTPRVSLVSREEFQNHGTDNSKLLFQKIPGEQDFPSLASAAPRGQAVPAQGRWGGPGSSILSGNSKPMAKKPTKVPPAAPVQAVPMRQEHSTTNYEHVSKTPLSLRGIDYIPSDAPAKPVVSLVDSNQFSAIKAARDQSDRCPISSEDLSPKSENSIKTNRFAAFNDNSAVTRPAISSELEFPSLGAPKVSSQPPVNANQNTKSKSQKSQQPIQPQQPVQRHNGPVISLIDVAMGLGSHVYKGFLDEDERNQMMCQRLFDSLDTTLATYLLQLSNQYRTRQIDVRDYVDTIQSDFADRLDAVSKILPQMCVLLPDIPLQRSLMTTMPKKWVRDLRECITCSQVLHKSDIAAHNRLAH